MKNAPVKIALALLAMAFPARATEIGQYSTRLAVEPDGVGHATSTLVMTGGPSETVEVPLSHRAWTNFRLTEAPEGLRVEPPKAKAATVRVTLPAEPADATRVIFTFDVPQVFAKTEDPEAGEKLTIPRESRTLRYAFVNTQASLIKDFEMLVTLPEGFRVQAIREQLPRQTKSEVEPRVRLGGEGGRQNALLQLTNLEQGDDTSMRLEVLPNRQSLVWLVAGVVLSVLYLVRFRDLVARKEG